MCSSPAQNSCNLRHRPPATRAQNFHRPESELFPEQSEGVEDAEHCNPRVSENCSPDVGQTCKTHQNDDDFYRQCENHILHRDASGRTGDFHRLRDSSN